jgi:hypothetical protein
VVNAEAKDDDSMTSSGSCCFTGQPGSDDPGVLVCISEELIVTHPSESDGFFVVDLRGVALPEGAAQSIARAIRRAALTELAGLEIETPLSMSFTDDGSHGEDALAALPIRPLGLWFDPSKAPPEQ